MQKEMRSIVLYYINNLLRMPDNSDFIPYLARWADEYLELLFNIKMDHAIFEKMTSLKAAQKVNDAAEQLLQDEYSEVTDNKHAIQIIILRECIARSEPPNHLNEKYRLIAWADRIAESFRLSVAEREYIRLSVASVGIKCLGSFLESIIRYGYFDNIQIVRSDILSLLQHILKFNSMEVKKVFSRSSNLIQSGLMTITEGGYLCQSKALKDLIFLPPADRKKDIKSIILTKASKTDLLREDFYYMKDDYDFLLNILKSALHKKTQGINILLYGPPGTGKTELTKVLCTDIGCNLYTTSETIVSFSSKERLSEQAVAKSLLRNDGSAVLMFDEAEDVFNCLRSGKANKISINRILESNRTPVVWITNNAYDIDSAHLRRFSFALNMKVPPSEARSNIWKKMLKKNKVFMKEEEIVKLAENYEIPPSFASSSVKVAKLLKNPSAVVRTLDSLEKVCGGKMRKPDKDPSKKKFLPELLNSDTDLNTLCRHIIAKGIKRFSLCLSGPPGTGKSEFVRFIAEQINLPVLQKRASDLISMFVGQTERNIAKAFREAEEEKKFLIFDEADSFLRDRKQASRSYEITEVNEMLTWMESHPLPFACTTNLLEGMDGASLRRFTFKIKLSYLTASQCSLAFKYFFGIERNIDLECLTPADFALVANKVNILNITSPCEILEMLRAEDRYKETKSMKIGF
ncbi:MAG: AAA family ATPase [Deltaproteobacteria bacterium]|nr:AAA family ATPase [Deltaproteobacteria bacterium]